MTEHITTEYLAGELNKGAQAHRLKVGETVALIGFDDIGVRVDTLTADAAPSQPDDPQHAAQVLLEIASEHTPQTVDLHSIVIGDEEIAAYFEKVILESNDLVDTLLAISSYNYAVTAHHIQRHDRVEALREAVYDRLYDTVTEALTERDIDLVTANELLPFIVDMLPHKQEDLIEASLQLPEWRAIKSLTSIMYHQLMRSESRKRSEVLWAKATYLATDMYFSQSR